MNNAKAPLYDQNIQDLEAEIVRLNKIIQALMNRAERTMSIHGSDFRLFETAVLLEKEVCRRTAQLDKALKENEQINRALQRAQEQMQAEIAERKRAEEALKQANQRLSLLSTTDPLTGLANRRHFIETLTAEWQRALRTRTAISLYMIDIDHFKKYNDRYGHPAGDHCLCQVATALNTAVRRTDLVARYGGEEFTIILPNTDHETALKGAERARMAVFALRIPHVDNTHGVVTISVGVTAMVPSADTLHEQLINLADDALYAAKDKGRNCIRVFLQD